MGRVFPQRGCLGRESGRGEEGTQQNTLSEPRGAAGIHTAEEVVEVADQLQRTEQVK